MLFWMTIIIMFLSFILHVILFEHDFEVSSGLCGVIATICGFCLFIEIIVFGVNYIGVNANIQKMNSKHDMLVYQYENDIYDNDNDLGKRDLFEDICKWNEDLAWHKEAQDDVWIGIFIPDIYDQFDFIELGGK